MIITSKFYQHVNIGSKISELFNLLMRTLAEWAIKLICSQIVAVSDLIEVSSSIRVLLLGKIVLALNLRNVSEP